LTCSLFSLSIDTSTTLGLQTGNSIVALIGQALCIIYIDRLGRRRPLIAANALSSLAFIVGTALIAVYGPDGAKGNTPGDAVARGHARRGFVATTWFFNLVFSAAIGPLSWAVPVEMFGSKTRATATAMTSSAAWISNCGYLVSLTSGIPLELGSRGLGSEDDRSGSPVTKR
jgi:MFS family permease